jgi:hypothetical protein
MTKAHKQQLFAKPEFAVRICMLCCVARNHNPRVVPSAAHG